MTDFNNLALGAGIAQGGAQVASGITQSNAIEAQSNFDRANAELTAKGLDRQARDAELRGANDVTLIGNAAKRLQGKQVAASAGQGVDVNTGSALDAQVETDQMSEMDKLMARNNAAREAYGYRSAASATRSGAGMQAMGARNAARATMLQSYLNGSKDVLVGGYQAYQMKGLKKKGEA